MRRFSQISIGICTHGPVLLSEATIPERKFVISISKYHRSKHSHLICCKTTSKKLDLLHNGEFAIKDLFGKGPTKIQPLNICRVPKDDLESEFKYVGTLDSEHLPKFENGLRLLLISCLLQPFEKLNIADAWEPIFS